MSLRTIILQTANTTACPWILVSFEDESYSLVREECVTVQGELAIGCTCKVKEGRQVYNGRVLSIGSREEMENEIDGMDAEESMDEDEKTKRKRNRKSVAESKNKKIKYEKKEKNEADKKKMEKKLRKKEKGDIIVVTEPSNCIEKEKESEILVGDMETEKESEIYVGETEMDDILWNETYIDDTIFCTEKSRLSNHSINLSINHKEDSMSISDPLMLELTVSNLEDKVEKLKVALLELTKRFDDIEREAHQIPYNMYAPAPYYSLPPPPIPSTATPPIPSTATPPVILPPAESIHDPPLEKSEKLESASSTQQSQVICLPVKFKDNTLQLQSSCIKLAELTPAERTIERYPKLVTESKVGQLAVKLAKETFFGNNVLMKCTVMGCGKLPALPKVEINKLKKTIHGLFPKYWTNICEFEAVWKDCAEAIGQACKRLRHEH